MEAMQYKRIVNGTNGITFAAEALQEVVTPIQDTGPWKIEFPELKSIKYSLKIAEAWPDSYLEGQVTGGVSIYNTKKLS